MLDLLNLANFKWAVALQGSGPDIDDALRFFRHSSEVCLRQKVLPLFPERSVLLALEFNLLDQETDVYVAAGRILGMMNGILFLEAPHRDPLSISAVHRRRPDGNYDTGIVLNSVTVRVRGVKGIGQTGPQPVPEQSAWLGAGLTDDLVSDVLTYLRGEPDWFDLYKVCETIKSDTHKQGQRGPWANSKALSDFNRDAQLARHSREYCERRGIEPSNAMPLDEARTLVRSIVASWLRWRK